MGFYETYLSYKNSDLDTFLDSRKSSDMARILKKSSLDHFDFLTLLSPKAGPFLEEMAQKAHMVTMQQFGKTILLYTPMYLSNFCNNQCLYCGFNTKNKTPRNSSHWMRWKERQKSFPIQALNISSS